MRCDHHYHHNWGRQWLLEHESCPQCLQPILDATDLRNVIDNENKTENEIVRVAEDVEIDTENIRYNPNRVVPEDA